MLAEEIRGNLLKRSAQGSAEEILAGIRAKFYLKLSSKYAAESSPEMGTNSGHSSSISRKR
jgi:hypothetical protein